MRLIDILARELNEWPDGAVIAVQDLDGEVKFDHSDERPRLSKGKDVWVRQGDVGGSFRGSEVSSDYMSAIVNRTEWLDAVAALKGGVATYSAENVSVDCNFATLTNMPSNSECRIIHPVCNGEGLPPVGSVCEWAGCTFAPEDPKEPDLHVGDQVTIIAHFKDGDFDLAAFTFNPQIHNPDRGTAWVGQGAHGCFRPIRTPEQIAAEERDERLVAMSHAYQDITGESPSNAAHQAFRALDLAGYRKLEIVDGE